MAYQEAQNDFLQQRKLDSQSDETAQSESVAMLAPPALQLVAASEGEEFQNRSQGTVVLPFDSSQLPSVVPAQFQPQPIQRANEPATAPKSDENTLASPESAEGAEPERNTESPEGAAPAAASESAETGGNTKAEPQAEGEQSQPESEEKAAPEGEQAAESEAAPEAMADGAGAAAGGGADLPPASPEEDPNFQAVEARSQATAEQEQDHQPATDSAANAQSAAVSPASEVASEAQNNQMGEMQAAETPAFDAAAFKAKLMEQIRNSAPGNLEEANNFKNSNNLDSVKGNMKTEVEGQKSQSTGTLEQTTEKAPDTGSVNPRESTTLEPESAGSPPASIQADQAVPPPRSPLQVEQPIRENSQSLDQQMTEADVSEEQLANSNEPEFQGALDSKREAQTHAATAPAEARADEQAQIEGGRVDAEATAQGELALMHGSREEMLAQVLTGQQETISQDEAERARIAAEIQSLYDQTKTNVDGILSQLDQDVDTAFNEGAESATQAFENYVGQRMDDYKDRRYDGWRGKLRWGKDKLFGMPSEVNAFYTEGKDLYLQQMDGVIDRVVGIIGTGLAAAKAEVATGRQQVADYVASLPQNLQSIGQEAASNIQSKFDTLDAAIDSKQDELVTTLAQKYNERLQAIDSRIEELKAANQGLVDKALNAVVGVIKTILRLKDMLLNVLARAAGIIGTIIKDPIGFLGNLISGVKAGLDRFTGNIMTHLQTGLIGWLTGAMGGMGIEIPEDIFSLKGIFSLATQILGLGWDFIRAKAVRLFGDRVVGAMEQGFELFQILMNEGLGGLWEYIKEKFSDLKAMVMDQIKDMIITQVITAGIKWLVGLLNPASAFIKAAMAIYDIVHFFITRGSQIMDLVNAILDSIAAVAGGNISAMATKIEEAMARALPVIIGFLASLLGIGGLADKVKGIVLRVRDRISQAVDGMLEGLRGVAGRFMRFLGVGGKEGEDQNNGPDERTPEQKQKDLDAGLQEADALSRRKNISLEDIRSKLPSIKAAHKMEYLRLVVDEEKGGKSTIHFEGKVNPEDSSPPVTVDFQNDANYTPDEKAKLNKLPGGSGHLTYVNSLITGSSDKLPQALAEGRTALNALARGESDIQLGQELFNGAGQLKTEIDVLTSSEMIEVKGGDYSDAKKLSGRDQTQFVAHQRFFNGTKEYFDQNGNSIQPPSKWIYQFRSKESEVDSRLVSWLLGKGVTEVRFGS